MSGPVLQLWTPWSFITIPYDINRPFPGVQKPQDYYHYNKPVVVLMDAAAVGAAEIMLAGLAAVARRVPGTIQLVGTETGKSAG